MNKEIDDYDLFDQDIEEFMRRGRESLEWEAQNTKENDNPQ